MNEQFEKTFMIDFNLHQVPAALGLEVGVEAGAAILGMSQAAFAAHVAEVDAGVRKTAKRLLEKPDLARALEHLEQKNIGTLMTVGDSITTYRRGYAPILKAMLELHQPERQLRFLNVGQSGYTSTHGKELTFTQLLSQQPDLVTIKFGANDSKHFGSPSEPSLVSQNEYRENVDAMVRGFQNHTKAQIVLLSPTPVIESVVNSSLAYQSMHMTWDNADIRGFGTVLQAIAQKRGLTFVDFYSIFGDTPNPDLYLEDGLHPSPAGHELMLSRLLLTLEGTRMEAG
jgi:lysophospholipase L1-like esterase